MWRVAPARRYDMIMNREREGVNKMKVGQKLVAGLLLLAAVGKSMCTERTSPELAGLVDTVVTLAVFTLCSSCVLFETVMT